MEPRAVAGVTLSMEPHDPEKPCCIAWLSADILMHIVVKFLTPPDILDAPKWCKRTRDLLRGHKAIERARFTMKMFIDGLELHENWTEKHGVQIDEKKLWNLRKEKDGIVAYLRAVVEHWDLFNFDDKRRDEMGVWGVFDYVFTQNPLPLDYEPGDKGPSKNELAVFSDIRAFGCSLPLERIRRILHRRWSVFGDKEEIERLMWKHDVMTLRLAYEDWEDISEYWDLVLVHIERTLMWGTIDEMRGLVRELVLFLKGSEIPLTEELKRETEREFEEIRRAVLPRLANQDPETVSRKMKASEIDWTATDDF